MKGESPRRLDTELYEETNEKDSWGPRFPLADPSISSQVLVSRLIGQVPTAGQKRGSRRSQLDRPSEMPHFREADFWPEITSG